jgi:hypothetical protein
MAGLVVLGLLTVIAGVLSGRSTINYVLTRDMRQASQSQSEFVSKLDGFAVLDGDATPLAAGGNLSPTALEAMLAQGDVKAAIARTVTEDRVVAAAMPGDSNLRLAFVPASSPSTSRRASSRPRMCMGSCARR